jgi:hypothetical protein
VGSKVSAVTRISQRYALHNVHDGANWQGSKPSGRAHAGKIENCKLQAGTAQLWRFMLLRCHENMAYSVATDAPAIQRE